MVDLSMLCVGDRVISYVIIIITTTSFITQCIFMLSASWNEEFDDNISLPAFRAAMLVVVKSGVTHNNNIRLVPVHMARPELPKEGTTPVV